jgi:hypothetical protein
MIPGGNLPHALESFLTAIGGRTDLPAFTSSLQSDFGRLTMRRAALLSTVVLILGVGGMRAADDDARTIITKGIKAHGGEDILGKMKAGQSQNKGKMKLPGVGEVEFTQEIMYLLPDKLKETLSMEIANQKISVTTIVNGEKVSINANGTDIEINDDIKKLLKDAREMMKAARLVSLLKDKEYQLSVIGESKVEGKSVLGVHIEAKGKKDLNLFFNKETGLLAKMEFRSMSPATQKEVTEERIIVEYQQKDKNSPPFPKKVIVKHDGEQFMEAEVVDVKLLETIDESEFKK